ncbi:MAG TPA: hypothetical protein PK358_14445 [Spirochaetota bacterium]|nr:hypothetical protein [Spirochaetota bacterium]
MPERNKKSPSPYKLLIAATPFGGDLDSIKSLTKQYDYSIDELQGAIDFLADGTTSALEQQCAKEAINYLNMLIDGQKFINKHPKR